MNLYFHIPFCLKRCSYCTFYAMATPANGVPSRAYVEALIAEMDLLQSRYQLQNRPVGTIFLGGGTPSMLDPDDIHFLLDTVRKRCLLAADAEITMESNPETLTEQRLQEFFQAGINRLSIGVQSFQDHFLRQLGRVHDSKTACHAIEQALALPFDSVSIDLMWGFRGQKKEDLKKDLAMLKTLMPHHVSLYQLTHDMKGRNELHYEVDDELAEWMWTTVCDTLESAGFAHYEISNFARKGHHCRHNMGYWHYSESLGIGTSAVGFLIDPSSEKGFGKRIRTASRLDDYLAHRFSHDVELISRNMARSEYAFLAFRTSEGVSFSRFFEHFGIDFHDVFPGIIEKWAQDGLAKPSAGGWQMTRQGWKLSNFLLSELV